MLLEVDNIELNLSGQCVLKGIYLKAETGKITGILGANGCGKSSLLNVIFGDLQPRHKLIRIDNKPYLKPLFTYAGMVKYLPQQNFIPQHLKVKTVFDLFGISWEECIAYFESLNNYRDSRIKELSGGEKRIIETYLVVKGKAEILLLDEPFTHLAPIYINTFRNILRQEATHKAIIITDHLFHHIIDIADDLYAIKNGCTRLIKDPEELKDLDYLNAGSLTK